MYTQVPKTQSIVQKYGGTSVGTVERIQNVAKRVAAHHRDGWRRMAIVVSAMSGETNRLVSLMKQVNPKSPAKAYDMAVASGEQVSVALMAAALAAEGIEAEPLLSHQIGILTDNFHSKARIKSIDVRIIEDCWSRGEIPVIAGFQGVTESMEITTLGRGGSDTSAVALAVALDASFCEINTDVDGVYSCDPRVVPTARLIEKMDFEVALEMASLGSKVLHPRCVEIAAKFQMPIVVRNTFTDNNHQRTCVMNLGSLSNLESPVVSGVTVDRDVAKISIMGLPTGQDYVAKLFSAVAQAGVNVDVIVHHLPHIGDTTQHLGFTTPRSEADAAVDAIKKLIIAKALPDVTMSIERDLAKVSVVGVGMHSHPGVAAKTFETIARAGADVKMISTSEIKISCVIPQVKADDCCRQLHEAFIE